MALIFYGVQGEGLGHATRSRTIVGHLQKKHKVIIFCGGRAYNYLSKHYDKVVRVTSPHIFYKKNRASNFRTLFLNLVKIPHFLASYMTFRKWSYGQRPDVIITDFEPISNYFGLLHKIPTISVDNQHVISKSDFEFSRKESWQSAKTKGIIKLFIWKARKYFVINFFFPPINDPDCKFVKPIIRPEIERLRPQKKNFVLVYQTSFTDTNLVPALIDAGEKMVVYGFPKPGIEKNVTFVEFDEKHFFNDLKNCKAIITNGGQSLICEAIYLKKPVLSVPIKNQFEQSVNAYYIEKLGFGEYHKKISADAIKSFMLRLPVYEKNLKKERMIGNQELFKQLDAAIGQLQMENTGIAGRKRK